MSGRESFVSLRGVNVVRFRLMKWWEVGSTGHSCSITNLGLHLSQNGLLVNVLECSTGLNPFKVTRLGL